jgi:hypothetical protein
VEFDGSRVSTGTLSGALPGVPVVWHVWPAAFDRDGLRVFAGEAARSQIVETPSKTNGWNRVQFEFDPARASELVILEAPNRSNEYKRMVVRNDARNCPVIIVDWTVTP